MKQLFLILFLISVCTTFAAADLLEGLVLYMPLDEGNGKATEDFSENGLKVNSTAAQNGLMANLGKPSNLAHPAILSQLKMTQLFILKMKLHKPRGLISTDCRVRTPLFSAPVWAVVEDTSDSATG